MTLIPLPARLGRHQRSFTSARPAGVPRVRYNCTANWNGFRRCTRPGPRAILSHELGSPSCSAYVARILIRGGHRLPSTTEWLFPDGLWSVDLARCGQPWSLSGEGELGWFYGVGFSVYTACTTACGYVLFARMRATLRCAQAASLQECLEEAFLVFAEFMVIASYGTVSSISCLLCIDVATRAICWIRRCGPSAERRCF